MQYDIEITLTGNRQIEQTDVDKVELLNVGRGLLSVIKNEKEYCFSLDTILWYTVTEKRGERCLNT